MKMDEIDAARTNRSRRWRRRWAGPRQWRRRSTPNCATMQRRSATPGARSACCQRGISRGLRSAFDGLVFDGMKLSDALKTVGQVDDRCGLQRRDPAGDQPFRRAAWRRGSSSFIQGADAVREGRLVQRKAG